MSRQYWLRRRIHAGDPVDPRPMEAAVLEPGADTMRDMVQREVANLVQRARDDETPDDDFLDDELAFLHDEDVVISDWQMTDYAETLLAEQVPFDLPAAEQPPEGLDPEGTPVADTTAQTPETVPGLIGTVRTDTNPPG